MCMFDEDESWVEDGKCDGCGKCADFDEHDDDE
ncbi:hypothetical protein LCGC14_2823540 [marine sediment metagenome]|uniref:4Fe-4S ferredoxin-type domain-containing protein n=1 Tax=marine sediment metagenome TaxID=412755 RepID=A0A0F8Z319_9ZZZZ